MALLRVFGNTYLTPACVGKVEHTPDWGDGKRTFTTTVYDLPCNNVVLVAETTIPVPDPKAVERDNFIHSEIIAALHEGRNANAWREPGIPAVSVVD